MVGTGQKRAVRLYIYDKVVCCRQLETHRSRWNLQKLMCDMRMSWMKSRWTDLQVAAASQQMQEVQDAQEQCFADNQLEVGRLS